MQQTQKLPAPPYVLKLLLKHENKKYTNRVLLKNE